MTLSAPHQPQYPSPFVYTGLLTQLLYLLTLLMLMVPAHAQDEGNEKPILPVLRAILEQPESEIDFAKAKLTIDHMIDPELDVDATMRQLDQMADEVRRRWPAPVSNLMAADNLRRFLYEPGPWNFSQPFRYDFDDPFGRNVHNKLLATYLSTRKGNCVSMPLLFLALGQKLGIDMTMAQAPEHLFIKLKDDAKGGYLNFEATSGGLKSDASYQRDYTMTPQAIANGLYLRPLSKKETLVLMVDALIQSYSHQEPIRGMAVIYAPLRFVLSELQLKYYPTYVNAMLNKSAAIGEFMGGGGMYASAAPLFDPNGPSPAPRHNSDFWRSKAEALGWRQPTVADNRRYQQFIDRVKSVQ